MSSTGITSFINIRSVCILVFIAASWVNLNHERWKGMSIIDHDINNYYSYLPALFYENDLTLSFLDDDLNRQHEGRYYWPNKAPNGNHVIKQTMGMAITYLPFFTLAHIYCKITGQETSGFTPPYHFAVLFSSLFCFIAGIYFLGKTLSSFFGECYSAITILLLSFGTNVFYYLTVGAGLAHIVGFTLVAVFIYYTVSWYKSPAHKKALFLGLCLGMLIVVRPVNGLVIIFFLCYGIRSFSELKHRFELYRKYLKFLWLIPLCASAVILPQLIYWKWITGQFLFNSYVGERFYFSDPHIIEGLFSFRKGWLVYTPIMIIALAGFGFLWQRSAKDFLVPCAALTAVYIYVVFSWWCWWYGGSFGQRPMIDIYPVLAFPFTAMMYDKLKPRWLRATMFVFCGLFVELNLFQTMQAKYNIIHFDSMTKENYFRVFFTIREKPDVEKYLDHPDYAAALKGEDE